MHYVSKFQIDRAFALAFTEKLVINMARKVAKEEEIRRKIGKKYRQTERQTGRQKE